MIAVNTRGKKDTVRLPTGEEMKQVSSATYLGGQLRKDGAARPEVESRLSKAAVTFRKLTPLWRDAACEERWKLQVCNAVVFTVLTYGLETLPFTKSLESRLNYFQAKYYRNIMKVQAAYYSKVSNKEMLDSVSVILHGEAGKVQPMSRIISDRAVTLLGHVFRSNEDDHMRKVAIDAEFKRVEREKRRVGRPRFYWLCNTMSRAHRLWCKNKGAEKVDFDIKNADQRREIAEAAQNREHPFDKKHKTRRFRTKHKKKKRNDGNSTATPRGSKAKRRTQQKDNKNGKRNRGHHRRAQTGSWNGSAGRNDGQDQRRGQGDNGHDQRGRQQYWHDNLPGSSSSHNNNNRTQNDSARKLRDLGHLKENLRNNFQTLNCDFTTDEKKLKTTFRKEALRRHPDKGGNTADFQRLNNDYEKIMVVVTAFKRKYPCHTDEAG